MHDIVLLVLVALATYRLTRLVAVDRITQAPREWLQFRLEDRAMAQVAAPPKDPDQWQSMGAYLLGCMWCASVWVGGLVVLAAELFIGLSSPWWLVWPAASAVTGWLASNEGD